MPVPANEDLMSQVGPYAVYTRPIIPPITLPNISDEPMRCLTVNTQWMSYILGCAQTLARYETWWTDRDETAELVQQAHSIPTFISDDCGSSSGILPTNWYGTIFVDGGDAEFLASQMLAEQRAFLLTGVIRANALSVPEIRIQGRSVGDDLYVGGHMNLRIGAISGTAHVYTLFTTNCEGSVSTDTGLNANVLTGDIVRKEVHVIYDGDIFFQFYCYGPWTCGPV